MSWCWNMLESSDWSFRLIQMGVSGGGEMWSLEVVEALCGPLEEKAKVALLTDVASLFFFVSQNNLELETLLLWEFLSFLCTFFQCLHRSKLRTPSVAESALGSAKNSPPKTAEYARFVEETNGFLAFVDVFRWSIWSWDDPHGFVLVIFFEYKM